MFRPNKKHLQTAIFTSVDQLSPKRQRRLKESWAGIFYREFFYRLDEELDFIVSSPIKTLIGILGREGSSEYSTANRSSSIRVKNSR